MVVSLIAWHVRISVPKRINGQPETEDPTESEFSAPIFVEGVGISKGIRPRRGHGGGEGWSG